MNIINQYSYILILISTTGGIYWVLNRYFHIRKPYIFGTITITIGIFATIFVILRPGLSTVSDFEQAQALIGNGQPTFVEFFSNYCTGCIIFEPIVADIVSDVEAEFNILRVDIHSEVGREMRTNYRFSFTPEFVLYDPIGNEVWRDHIPPGENDLNLARTEG